MAEIHNFAGPGAGFQKKAQEWAHLTNEMPHKPFKAFRDAVIKEKRGGACPSMVALLLKNVTDGSARSEEEGLARNAAGVAYAGGTDTTVAAVQSFLARLFHPAVQKQAQAEIVSVVGRDRPPDFGVLPYINAIIKEAMH